MRIYIDESGNFRPGDSQSRVCCECALVVPELVADELATRFSSLRSKWTAEPEVKGSSLTDEQHLQVLTLVGEYDVMVEIVAMDCSQPAHEIESFCRRAGDAIVEKLTPRHHVNAHKFLHQLKRDWWALPTQLQAQLYILMFTIEDVIRMAPNYYLMRLPDDLGRFDWILDPKDIKPTPFEKVWERLVCPILQSRSVDEPTKMISDIASPFDRYGIQTPGYIEPMVLQRSPELTQGCSPKVDHPEFRPMTRASRDAHEAALLYLPSLVCAGPPRRPSPACLLGADLSDHSPHADASLMASA